LNAHTYRLLESSRQRQWACSKSKP
jgi:hypothetical protein